MDRTQPSRLGIVHLLGWMAGCGVVLAFYRLTDLTDYPEQERRATLVLQALFAMVYGAALGGIAIWLWRRWRGDTRFPSQPGHWLLVLAGLGCLIDAAAFSTVTIMGRQPGLVYEYAPSPWHLHQALGWTMAALIGMIVTCRSRGAGAWRCFAAATTVVLVGNAAVFIMPCVWSVMITRGVWMNAPLGLTFVYAELPWHVRFAGAPLAVLALLLTLWCDRRHNPERDWLHWAGVLACVALAAIDMVQSGWHLAQWNSGWWPDW